MNERKLRRNSLEPTSLRIEIQTQSTDTNRYTTTFGNQCGTYWKCNINVLREPVWAIR